MSNPTGDDKAVLVKKLQQEILDAAREGKKVVAGEFRSPVRLAEAASQQVKRQGHNYPSCEALQRIGNSIVVSPTP